MKILRQPSTDSGTFGSWYDDDGKELCVTVELPWLNNHPQTSCIPSGVYTVERYESPRHGQVWQVMNVPDRSNIEIHGANTINDLLGCIGVGDSYGNIDGLPAVLNSQVTLNKLRGILPDSFTLIIS